MTKIKLKCSTVQDLAEVCTKYLTTSQRPIVETGQMKGEDYIFTSDKAPQWFKDLVYKAHKLYDVLPNDFIYKYIEEAIYLFSNNKENYEDLICEIEPDIYNFDLLKWVSSNLQFAYCVDEAIQEYGTDKNTTLFSLLSIGQQRMKQEIAQCILSGLETRLEEIKNS